MPAPNPTPILRFLPVGNLPTILARGGFHAPNQRPQDGLGYTAIHSVEVQGKRAAVQVGCGPGGTIHDYVPFYFGYLSPMMLNLKTGRVAGYVLGQEPLIYCVSTAQAVEHAGHRFVFSDGHGLAGFTQWFDDLTQLASVDWDVVNLRYWNDTNDEPDRQRRKQAEFLVHGTCPWTLIDHLVVISEPIRTQVEQIFDAFPASRRPVIVNRDWYYR